MIKIGFELQQGLDLELKPELALRQELQLVAPAAHYLTGEPENLDLFLRECPQAVEDDGQNALSYLIAGGWATELLLTHHGYPYSRDHHDLDVIRLSPVPLTFCVDEQKPTNYFGVLSLTAEDTLHYAQMCRWSPSDYFETDQKPIDVWVVGAEYLFISKIAGFMHEPRDKDLQDLAALAKIIDSSSASKFLELLKKIPYLHRNFQANDDLYRDLKTSNLLDAQHGSLSIDLAARYLCEICDNLRFNPDLGRNQARRFAVTLTELWRDGLKGTLTASELNIPQDLLQEAWLDKKIVGFWTKDSQGTAQLHVFPELKGRSYQRQFKDLRIWGALERCFDTRTLEPEIIAHGKIALAEPQIVPLHPVALVFYPQSPEESFRASSCILSKKHLLTVDALQNVKICSVRGKPLFEGRTSTDLPAQGLVKDDKGKLLAELLDKVAHQELLAQRFTEHDQLRRKFADFGAGCSTARDQSLIGELLVAKLGVASSEEFGQLLAFAQSHRVYLPGLTRDFMKCIEREVASYFTSGTVSSRLLGIAAQGITYNDGIKLFRKVMKRPNAFSAEQAKEWATTLAPILNLERSAILFELAELRLEDADCINDETKRHSIYRSVASIYANLSSAEKDRFIESMEWALYNEDLLPHSKALDPFELPPDRLAVIRWKKLHRLFEDALSSDDEDHWQEVLKLRDAFGIQLDMHAVEAPRFNLGITVCGETLLTKRQPERYLALRDVAQAYCAAHGIDESEYFAEIESSCIQESFGRSIEEGLRNAKLLGMRTYSGRDELIASLTKKGLMKKAQLIREQFPD